MGHFARQLSAQEIKQGYSLLDLMEHLDREMDLLNQQRGVMRVVNDRKRQGVVSPGMAQPHSRVRQAVGAATSR